MAINKTVSVQILLYHRIKLPFIAIISIPKFGFETCTVHLTNNSQSGLDKTLKISNNGSLE